MIMKLFKSLSPIWFAVILIWIKTIIVSFIGFNLHPENWTDILFMLLSPIGAIMAILDFVTVPILFQFKNVGGIGPSTLELISPWDLLLFADLAVFWLFYIKRKPVHEQITAKKKRF